MSFIDQLMAARGLPVSNRLFGNNIGGTPQNISQQFLQRMGGTPPINPNPNLPSIPKSLTYRNGKTTSRYRINGTRETVKCYSRIC